MTTIAAIEDAVMETIRDLDLFRVVGSLGRKAPPTVRQTPAAFVYFVEESDGGVHSRPVRRCVFEILVAAKNVASEDQAARDVYTLLDAVDEAVNGKALALDDIETLTVVSRALSYYERGEIGYTLRIETRRYLPVVT